MRKKLIRLSDNEYDLLQHARTLLIRHGSFALPPSLQEKVRKNGVDIDDRSLGAVVGVCSAALIVALGEKKNE